ncbi:MAG: hypothetical protein K2G77_07255, partial [Muribaculaceae bacterium]|nr:hypothetical protein [Muribaculaceae bacterium]
RSNEVSDRMLAGEYMRQIPLDKGDRGGACIDYPQLERKGLSDADIPANTSFINKPESMFSKNPLAFAVALLILISLVQLVMYYLLFKGKTESFMKKREIKINHLPVNYFIGKVRYNEDGVPVEVQTTPGNQKAIELWERHAGECRCEPLFDEAEMLKAVARLSDDGKGVVYTEHFLKTDSYYEVNIHRGFDAETLEIFCFNITQRIRSEHDLKYTSAMLEMTLDLAQVVPWHWNLDSKTIELKYNEALRKVNRNLISINGRDISITEVMLHRLICPEDAPKVMELTKEVIEGKRKYAQMEFRILIPDNGRQVEEWLEVNESVERYNDEGKAEVLIGSFTCITERKEQMRRLIEARESAKEADRLKSAFLANMSHEIRTPLNAIVGFSNMLAETDDPAQKAKFINIIESNNEMLLQIISDILDLSKTEAGTMEFNMRATDINALLVNIGESVVDRVKPGVDLLCNFGAQSCWLDTDPNRLSQVVINFLTNASKFTETGSITYGYEVRGDNLYFYCHDTGFGISEENQKKVFERFIKLNSFVNGTGLGLPICKAIVEFLGGQIGVHSDGEGFGSTFWFEIPYRMAEIPEDEVAPLWTEPTIDLTMQHALSMPSEHHSEYDHHDHYEHYDHHDHHEHYEHQGAQYSVENNQPQPEFNAGNTQSEVIPGDVASSQSQQNEQDSMSQFAPAVGPDGQPIYPPQFGPDGQPIYPPQFGPDGQPICQPQFGPGENHESSEISESLDTFDSSEQYEQEESYESYDSTDQMEVSNSLDVFEPTETYDSTESEETPDSSEPTETYDIAESEETPDSSEPTETYDTAESEETTDSYEPTETYDTAESEETPDSYEYMETYDTQESEETPDSYESMETYDTAESEETPDSYESMETYDTAESEGTPDSSEPTEISESMETFDSGSEVSTESSESFEILGSFEPLVSSEAAEEETELLLVSEEESTSQNSLTDNITQESEDMSQQVNPNQPVNPNMQGYQQNGHPADPHNQQHPNAQNPYGQNPYGQQPFGQQHHQHPQQNPYGQQYPRPNPDSQQDQQPHPVAKQKR